MRRTVNPNFIDPLADEVRAITKKAGLSGFNADFVKDLVSLQAGGRYMTPDELGAEVMSRLNPQPNSKGQYFKPPRGRTPNRNEAIRAQYQDQMGRELNMRRATTSIDLSAIPGSTPLEKAARFLAYQQTKDKLAESRQDDDDGFLPNFDHDGHDIDEATKHFDDIEHIMADETVADLINSLPSKRKDFAMVTQKEIYDIAMNLNAYSSFRFQKSERRVDDMAGNEVHIRPIRDYSEIAEVEPGFWGLPDDVIALKLAQHQAMVQKNFIRVARKQLIGVLIDISGSMASDTKINVALGILMNRLIEVSKGNAELYFAFFDTSVYFNPDKNHAFDKASAKEAMRVIGSNNFNGGGTDIMGSLLTFRNQLDKMDGVKPEIVIVSDGGAGVDTSRLTKIMNPFKLHAFMIEDTNKQLMNAARQTGGVALERIGGPPPDLSEFSILAKKLSSQQEKGG